MNELHPDSIYVPNGGMNIDSNGINIKPNECVDAVNVVLSQAEVVARWGSTVLGDSQLLGQDILEFFRYVDPNEGTVLFAFCPSAIFKYVDGVGWSEISGGTLTGISTTQWSLTGCIDGSVGATVVAAASIYIRPNDPMAAGPNRALLYYDQVADSFKNLELTSAFPVSEEDTGVRATVASSVYTGGLGVTTLGHESYDALFEFMDPAAFVLRTTFEGIIATSGTKVHTLPVGKLSLGDPADGSDVECYRLLPVNLLHNAYDEDSWVRKDGKEWSCTFLSDFFQHSYIITDYDYARAVDYRPMLVHNFHNALVMGNTYEGGVYYPWRLRHTHQTDIFRTKESFYIDVAVDDISPILKLGAMETAYYNAVSSYLYLYKHGSILRASYNTSYNGGTNGVPFLSLETASSEGLESTRTVVSINGRQIFLGLNDVYAFDGVNRVSLTLDENTKASRVRNYLMSRLDLNSLDRNFAVYDETNKKYMLFVKLSGTTGTYPEDCFVYDLELGIWSRYTYPPTSAAMAVDITPNSTISGLVGNIEDLEGEIRNLSGNITKRVMFAMTDQVFLMSPGTTDKGGSNDPQPFDSYVITRDFLGDSLQNPDRTQMVMSECGGVGKYHLSYNAKYSINPLDFNYLGEYTNTGYQTNQHNPDSVAFAFRLMLRLEGSTSLRWLQVFSMKQEISNL